MHQSREGQWYLLFASFPIILINPGERVSVFCTREKKDLKTPNEYALALSPRVHTVAAPQRRFQSSTGLLGESPNCLKLSFAFLIVLTIFKSLVLPVLMLSGARDSSPCTFSASVIRRKLGKASRSFKVVYIFQIIAKAAWISSCLLWSNKSPNLFISSFVRGESQTLSKSTLMASEKRGDVGIPWEVLRTSPDGRHYSIWESGVQNNCSCWIAIQYLQPKWEIESKTQKLTPETRDSAICVWPLIPQPLL